MQYGLRVIERRAKDHDAKTVIGAAWQAASGNQGGGHGQLGITR
jgi:hypothetical protein